MKDLREGRGDVRGKEGRVDKPLSYKRKRETGKLVKQRLKRIGREVSAWLETQRMDTVREDQRSSQMRKEKNI